MTKVRKKTKLVKTIEKDSNLEKEFKKAFLPFLIKYPPFEVYNLFNRLRDNFYPKENHDNYICWFIIKMEQNFLRLAGIGSDWKEFRKYKVEKVFKEMELDFPLYLVGDLQLLLSNIPTDDVIWDKAEIAILSDLQRSALSYFFFKAGKERELTPIEQGYLKSEGSLIQGND